MILQRNEDWIWNTPNEQEEIAVNGIKLKDEHRDVSKGNVNVMQSQYTYNIWMYRNHTTAVYLK